MKKNDEITTSTSAPAEPAENFDAQSQGRTFASSISLFPYCISLYHF